MSEHLLESNDARDMINMIKKIGIIPMDTSPVPPAHNNFKGRRHIQEDNVWAIALCAVARTLDQKGEDYLRMYYLKSKGYVINADHDDEFDYE